VEILDGRQVFQETVGRCRLARADPNPLVRPLRTARHKSGQVRATRPPSRRHARTLTAHRSPTSPSSAQGAPRPGDSPKSKNDLSIPLLDPESVGIEASLAQGRDSTLTGARDSADRLSAPGFDDDKGTHCRAAVARICFHSAGAQHRAAHRRLSGRVQTSTAACTATSCF